MITQFSFLPITKALTRKSNHSQLLGDVPFHVHSDLKVPHLSDSASEVLAIAIENHMPFSKFETKPQRFHESLMSWVATLDEIVDVQ